MTPLLDIIFKLIIDNFLCIYIYTHTVIRKERKYVAKQFLFWYFHKICSLRAADWAVLMAYDVALQHTRRRAKSAIVSRGKTAISTVYPSRFNNERRAKSSRIKSAIIAYPWRVARPGRN